MDCNAPPPPPRPPPAHPEGRLLEYVVNLFQVHIRMPYL